MFLSQTIYAGNSGSAVGYGLLGGFCGSALFSAASRPRESTVVIRENGNNNYDSREYDLRRRELDLRERELALQRRKIRKSYEDEYDYE